MSDRYLPYGRQSVSAEDVAAVAEALESDYLTTGPAVAAFEAGLARACGSRHAVAVSSGTAALHAAYFAAGLGPGDEIVTSPLTFAATANAALYLGAAVRFVDVDPEHGLLDPEAARAAVGPRTRLIVGVDYAGQPADYAALGRLAADRELTVVADAAHSLGATRDGGPAGSLAHLSATSFHPVKLLTTAEGGAVTTDDDDAAARARRFRSHGFEYDLARMEEPEGPWSQEMHDLGFNYRLSDVHSALGLSQLRRLDAFVARRRELAERYRSELADLAALRLPAEAPGVRSAWHLFVVRVADAARRRPFFERLRGLGLGVQVHYRPVYLHPYYRRLGFRPGLCPVSEDFYSRCLSLPLYPGLTDDDAASVVERVRRAARETL
ncbi:MAG TPA: UDP-4-amino-4,6-dideoxy-N-acetyl-beta-L-altrosamine transaminase [Thermoanaerobaculia bacterium]|nr:UDP-4-amino-4,6-dideoxy-N-acetyl-beta-L-altrosamine transaminase [Thermoanaerobaculia bacterium]